MMTKRFPASVMFVAVALLFVATATPTPKARAADLQVKLIEGARNEGKLVIMASWKAEESKLIWPAFKKAYPFIKVEEITVAGVKGTERLKAEFAANKRTTDLINGREPDLAVLGMTQPWNDWFEVFPDTNKNLVSPSLAASRELPTVHGLAYRTDLVPPDLQPLTWEKLSDPRLKDGKIGLDISHFYFFGYNYPKWSDEETIRYFEEVIIPQKPKMFPIGQSQNVALIRGEIWVATMYPIHYIFGRLLPKGITTVRIGPGYAPATTKDITLLKGAPHPNAAKLFLHWTTTEAVQDIFLKARGRADPLGDNMVGRKIREWGVTVFYHPDDAKRALRDVEVGAILAEKLGIPVPKK